MNERPILFNGEMVRAILDGRKTQTRRIIKKQPTGKPIQCPYSSTQWAEEKEGGCYCDSHPIKGIIGHPGDELWVRETFSTDAIDMYPCPSAWYRADNWDDFKDPMHNKSCKNKEGQYADCLACWEHNYGKFKWKPSIHMPRNLSRIQLKITNIRVERLKEISREDAIKEGIKPYPAMKNEHLQFRRLWWNIYGERSWNENPWVWVIEFEVKK